MLVDPKVHELASLFIDDVVHETNRPVTPSQRAALVDRAAAAMQRAIEDEYEAIRQELVDDAPIDAIADHASRGAELLEGPWRDS